MLLLFRDLCGGQLHFQAVEEQAALHVYHDGLAALPQGRR